MAEIIADNILSNCVLHQRNQQFFAKKAVHYLEIGSLDFAERNQGEAAACHRQAWKRLAFMLDVEE